MPHPPTSIALELLAPAGSLESGLAALSAGADAIYVGAPKFGARAAAGVSAEDIEILVRHAHFWGAKVYVALNTILYDNELLEAERIIRRLYTIGVDALIIQDMGLLELDLPPIALHASTQCHNTSIAQLRHLEQLGFEQAVLARELSIEETRQLAHGLQHLRLETFVHGALCVSYSGHCYLSQAFAKRSANRGACAQYCRLPYSLVDSNGTEIEHNSHLLSLKDLNRSTILPELIEAGAVSFKIEGRLKSSSYVRNITAYYSQLLNQYIAQTSHYHRASKGMVTLRFQPNPLKSFARGATTYQLHRGAMKEQLIRPESPKAEGEPIGSIKTIKGNIVQLQKSVPLDNGDGIAFYTHSRTMEGTRINKVLAPDTFIVDNPQQLRPGMSLFRNYSIAFEKAVGQNDSALRCRGVKLSFQTLSWGFDLRIEDGYNPRIYAQVSLVHPIEKAQKEGNDKLRANLEKLGGTGLIAEEVFIESRGAFVPMSLVSELRRKATEAFTRSLLIHHRARPVYRTKETNEIKENVPQIISYLHNVANKKSEAFYRKWGAKEISPAFELAEKRDVPLMICRHCLRRHLGYCSLEKKKLPFKEPLFLVHGKEKIRLFFDCTQCQMLLFAAE